MGSIDEVRERVDIVELVGEYVPLRRAGSIYRGLCPFHDERTPSFVVFPDSGNWRCFGACATGGNCFDFVMRVENLDFRQSLELLARRTGVVLAPPSAAASQRQERRDRLIQASAAAAAFFHDRLMRGPDAEPARAYLRGRDFGIDVAQAFQLGWAPAGRPGLVEALRGQGFSEAEILAAGLARAREEGGLFDSFRGRLIFPIHDSRGRAVGFGARTLDPEGLPKYLNSPQSEIFDKGGLLFGLHRAAAAIRNAGLAVVVEGYTDVMRAHAAGFENVVASLGTALTPEQMRALKRLSSVIVLALDADAAGRAATLRGLEVAREATAGEPVPVPTARGLLRFEHRTDVELRVATLPAGRDPDDVIRAEPERWQALIAAAQPVMHYLFQVLTADLDLDEPRGKLQAADRLLPLIAGLGDEVARRVWLARLAEMVRVDEAALAARLPQSPGQGGRAGGSRGAGSERSGASRGAGPERRGARPGRDGGSRERRSGSPAGRSRAEHPMPEDASLPIAPDDPAAATPSESPPAWALEAMPLDAPPALAAPAPVPAVEFGEVRATAEEDGEARATAEEVERGPGALTGFRQPDPDGDWLLGQLLVEPRRLRALESSLRRDGQAALGPDDFEHPLDRDLILAIRYAARGAPPPDAPEEHRLDALPPELAARAAALRDRAAADPARDEREQAERLRHSVLRMRKRALERVLPGLRYLQSAAATEGERDAAADYNGRVQALILQILELTRLIAPPADAGPGKLDGGVRRA